LFLAALRARIAEALPRYVMDAFWPGPSVALAGLGEDAVPVGALALADTGWQRQNREEASEARR
jgi:hypothetical protein